MFIRKALLDNGTSSIVISCMLNTFLRIGGDWHIVRSRNIKINLIIFASIKMSAIWLLSMQISREKMKSSTLKFVLQLYPSFIIIIHFRWSWIMTCGTIKIFHVAYWLNFRTIYIPRQVDTQPQVGKLIQLQPTYCLPIYLTIYLLSRQVQKQDLLI